MLRRPRVSLGTSILLLVAHFLPATAAYALDGGTLRVNTFNGWKAFEVITAGEDVPGDGFSHTMQTHFDGAGAWLPDSSTLRLLVNHEVGNPDSTGQISEVNLDLAAFQTVLSNMISGGTTGGVSFVDSARQAYGRWSDDGGSSFIPTTDTSTTDLERFCSGQSYAPDTFGLDRGFVDEIYITGEEFGSPGHDRFFAIDSANRDIYTLSGVAGGPPGTPGIPFDSWENAALIDTGETSHVALLLSPDGGTQTLRLYVGEKGKDPTGATSSDFLARNGLAYGSWYWLIASYPSVGNTNNGSFSTSTSGALTSDKIEDVDTSPVDPTQVVLGDQTSGVFTFDFSLDFSSGFSPGASSFTITKIADTVGGADSLSEPDNVDWTDATTLGVNSHPDGIVFVNEDNSLGEIWMMDPDGTNRIKIANTTTGGESTGILDISELAGYRPGSIVLTNGQGTPASMSILINPDATLAAWCGDGVVEGTEDCDDGASNGTTTCGCALDCTYPTSATSCDDGDACTTSDTCDGTGACVGGAPPDCDDSNVCTDDSCDTVLGCQNLNNTGPCDDGDACTTADVCSGGACVGGPPPDCDDSEVCTDDSCDSVLGCQNLPNTGPCNDGSVCTTVDTCSGGVCVGGAPQGCGDGNPCTDDTCDPVLGCQNPPNTDPCDDGDACTEGDACSGGVCASGGPVDCNDANPCTSELCFTATGCQYVNNARPCDDGDACTEGDRCGGGVCQPGLTTPDCDDSEACTADSCDSVLGCVNDPIPGCGTGAPVPSASDGTRVLMGLLLLSAGAIFLVRRGHLDG